MSLEQRMETVEEVVRENADAIRTLTAAVGDEERGNMALHKRVLALEKDKVKLAAYVCAATVTGGLILKALDHALPHITHLLP